MIIYLCDDSESDILRLEHYLHAYAVQMSLDFKLISFSSGEELLADFQASSHPAPELIFLDIFMTGQNGMAVARRLRSMDYSGGIIFTTSSTEHAMDSYEVNALYYLQKPYDRTHFENAMKRCASLLLKARPHFSFLQRKQTLSVPYEDILFFETGSSHTVCLHTAAQTYSFSGSLTQLAKHFEPMDCFLPVGRSYLVNLNHVTGIRDYDLLISDGSAVQIPLRKYKTILSEIKRRQNKTPSPILP